MNKSDFSHVSPSFSEKLTHFCDFWAKTLTGLALFSVLNACWPEKKTDDNLQNEWEKGKMEVVLDSNEWKMGQDILNNFSQKEKETQIKSFWKLIDVWCDEELITLTENPWASYNGNVLRFQLWLKKPKWNHVVDQLEINKAQSRISFLSLAEDWTILWKTWYEATSPDKIWVFMKWQQSEWAIQEFTINDFINNKDNLAVIFINKFKKSLQMSGDTDLANLLKKPH